MKSRKRKICQANSMKKTGHHKFDIRHCGIQNKKLKKETELYIVTD